MHPGRGRAEEGVGTSKGSTPPATRQPRYNKDRILADAQDARDRDHAERAEELQRHTDLLNAWRDANARAVRAERIPRTFLAKRDARNLDRKAKAAERKAFALAETERLRTKNPQYLDPRYLYVALRDAFRRRYGPKTEGLSRASLRRYLKRR